MTTAPINENFVEEIRAELADIDQLPIHEHASEFERLHNKLGTALSTIDGL